MFVCIYGTSLHFCTLAFLVYPSSSHFAKYCKLSRGWSRLVVKVDYLSHSQAAASPVSNSEESPPYEDNHEQT